MGQLVFYRTGEEIMRVNLEKSSTSFGRASKNDISLSDSNISRTHFIIQKIDERFVLVDKSKNGTVVNGEKILNRELKEKDDIKVGNWNIVFRAQEKEDKEDLYIANCDPVIVKGFNHKKGILCLQKGKIKCKADKKSYNVEINKSIVTIGRDASNDIAIKDKKIDLFHATLNYHQNKYTIKDLNTAAGTFLSGVKIKEAELHSGDKIKIGNAQLDFSTKKYNEKIKEYKDPNFEGMYSKDKNLRINFSLAKSIAKTECGLIFMGEDGTGKESTARAIHRLSHRKYGKFVVVNLTAMNKEHIAEAFFGHEKGLFVGVEQQREGALELAKGGTLYIKGIELLTKDLAGKLLTAIKEKRISRIGSAERISVNIRVLAGSNMDIEKLAKEKKFNKELFEILGGLTVKLPSLRDRARDIASLALIFINENLSAEMKKSRMSNLDDLISKEALKKLQSYSWPYNITELKSIIKNSLFYSGGKRIEEEQIDLVIESSAKDTYVEPREVSNIFFKKKAKSLYDEEKDFMLFYLLKNKWDLKKTSEDLGISEKVLFNKIDKYKLSSKR